MKDDELQQTIARLRADYAKQLPLTVAKMEALWPRLVAEGMPPSQLDELVRMAHSIAGSAATFGVRGASEAAHELELFLDRLGKSGQLPGKAEQQVFSVLLAALMQAADRL